MKKILLGLVLVILIGASYLIYTEYSFSPLKEDDFKKLFKGYVGKPNTICSKDFIGMSAHGEVFDIYVYSTKNALINKDFPEIIEWENKKITSTTVIGKWRNCPIDSQTKILYEPIFGVENFKNVKECSSSFNEEMINPKNHYSYIYFSEGEEYFLLCCTDRQELYYIRFKGF